MQSIGLQKTLKSACKIIRLSIDLSYKFQSYRDNSTYRYIYHILIRSFEECQQQMHVTQLCKHNRNQRLENNLAFSSTCTTSTYLPFDEVFITMVNSYMHFNVLICRF